ncbi:hypothetical protein HDU67_005227 [Dinochytrium kinnereticum]|nr:hypothetical protein HDU67_005227 [Dinochytrium kinnereticum]
MPPLLLRIVALCQGDPPHRAFTTHLPPDTPISTLRQHISHRLGNVPDFSMTLFLVPEPVWLFRDRRVCEGVVGLGGRVLVDPFVRVGEVFGVCCLGDEGIGEEVLEGDLLHLVVVLERNPGGPPSYEELKEKPLETIAVTDDKKQLHQVSVLTDFATKLLKEEGGTSVKTGLAVPLLAPPRINSRGVVVPHSLEMRTTREAFRE